MIICFSKNNFPVALWTFTACQMPHTGLFKGHYWTIWGFLEHQYLPFWLFIFLLNVNHDASEEETSFYILFLSSTEPVISQFSTVLYIAILHSTVIGESVVQSFWWLFSMIHSLQIDILVPKWIGLDQDCLMSLCNIEVSTKCFFQPHS